jgi:hypothetical protein
MVQPNVQPLLPGAGGTSLTHRLPAIDFPRFKKRWAREDRLVRLGASLFHVYAFETRRGGEPRTCPPRTVGVTSLLSAGSPGGLDGIGVDNAVELCLKAGSEPCPTEAAKEKVIFASRQGETLVYQADRQHRSAALCACGNATGAAAAMLAHCLRRQEIRQSLRLPDGQVEALSHVSPRGGAWRVQQSWSGFRPRLVQTRLRDRAVAICTGAFNDYLIVRLPGMSALEGFDLEEVLALWQEARQFAGFEEILQSRLVAVAPNDPQPYAKFYTCGRMHPGAPLTGLATLAVAAGHVDWLKTLLQAGRIEHRRGVDALPALRVTPEGAAIRFPAIDVVLRGL